MKLVKVRIRGLGPLPVTDWLETNHNLNLFQAPEATRRNGIITALEALSPPYRCRDVQPFRELPLLIRQNGHHRTVSPRKRTMVMGVYDSTATLVDELAGISPLLFETALIEVGRRLDYSRWVNFIELAASTRWSEIAARINRLRSTSHPAYDREQALFQRLDALKPTDRITGNVMRDLSDWLELHRMTTPSPARESITELVALVRRADSFAKARDLIRRRLPLFVVLSFGMPTTSSPSTATVATPAATLERLTALAQKRLGEKSRSTRDQLVEQLNREWHKEDHPYRITASWQESRLSLSFRDAGGFTVSPRLFFVPGNLQVSGSQAIALANIISGVKPIALIPLPERQEAGQPRHEMAAPITELASRIQCFCIGDIDRYFPGEPRREL